MNVYRDLNQLPPFRHAVITIGTFDGVHLGHTKLVDQINKMAAERGGESILITFDPHPRLVINPGDQSLRLLQTLEEKIQVLKEKGLANLVIVPFSRAFSNLSAEEYVRNFLMDCFHPEVIVIGYDHRFGNNRSGGVELLQSMRETYGFEVVEIPKETIDQMDISSTKIRNALMNGEVELANELLGYSYRISGTVVKGLQNGRKLGYPTANIHCADAHKLIPLEGVYAVKVKLGKESYQGMLNIGFNPTFDGQVKTIEVNLLDFNRDIYGEWLEVELLKYMRAEIRFDSLEALIEAIARDEINIRAYLNR